MRLFPPRPGAAANCGLLLRMLERLQVDPVAAWRRPFARRIGAMARACAACPAANRCEAWLDRNGALEERYRFCPNAETLDTLPRKG